MNLLNQVQSIYEKNLKEDSQLSEKVNEYLKQRGLTDETICEFGIGVSTNNIKEQLEEHQGELVANGILNVKGNERNYKRVMFPLHNENGKLIGFNGRTLEDKKETDEVYIKYLLSPQSLEFDKSKTLYNLHRAKEFIEKEDRVYIVEGVLDCMALWQVGKQNVVCTLGSALTKEHIELLKKYTNNYVICYDNDKAGFSASIKNAQYLSRELRKEMSETERKAFKSNNHIHFIKLPKECDPNDLYLKDKNQLMSCLESPMTYLNYCQSVVNESPSYYQVFEDNKKHERKLIEREWSSEQAKVFKRELRHANVCILSVAQDLGIDVQKRGRNWFGNCPLHGENTPSFSISVEKQIFKCFGCGSGGDVIALVQEIKDISYQESMQYIENNYLSMYREQQKERRKERVNEQQITEKNQGIGMER